MLAARLTATPMMVVAMETTPNKVLENNLVAISAHIWRKAALVILTVVPSTANSISMVLGLAGATVQLPVRQVARRANEKPTLWTWHQVAAAKLALTAMKPGRATPSVALRIVRLGNGQVGRLALNRVAKATALVLAK
jgi:hypothetical protein